MGSAWRYVFAFIILVTSIVVPDYSTACVSISQWLNRNVERNFTNFRFGNYLPSEELIEKWFHVLNDEAKRQGILCYVDSKALKKDYPALGLRENTEFNFNWVDGEGYVVKITKSLTDAKGQTPVVNEVPLPSSTTCKYWLQRGEESCSCHYQGGKHPGEDFYKTLRLSYPVYKRRPHRPASELTVGMFGSNENPESKLKALSQQESMDLLRYMKSSHASSKYQKLPDKHKEFSPEVGSWAVTEFITEGNEVDGHSFTIILWVAEYLQGGNFSISPKITETFNTKTRQIGSLTGQPEAHSLANPRVYMGPGVVIYSRSIPDF